MLATKTESLWDIRSLYEFQYFNCPACHFKTEYFKTQDFVDHACALHPESTNYLRNIDDGSMEDVDIPWESTGNEDLNLEENRPVIKVDHNGDTLKIEVNDDISDSGADPHNFLSSDIDEEENLDHSDHPENFCSLCEKQFNSLADWELHLQTIHTNNSEIELSKTKSSTYEKSKRTKDIYYFCSLCEKQFYSCSDLELHLQTIHSTNSDEIETKETNTSTSSENLNEKSKRPYVKLLSDTRSEDMKRTYSDYFDITSLGSVSVIKNGHKKTRTNSKAVCLTCQAVIQCPQNSYESLKYHAEKVHNIKLGTNPESYYAAIEKKYSERVNNSNEEQIMKNNENSVDDSAIEKSYKCEFIDCLATYKGQPGLRTHMIEVHGKEYKCDICENGFKKKYLLKEHLATTHNIFKADLKCYECDKVFNCKKSLNNHRNIHHTKEAEKKPECGICFKKFTFESALKKHVLVVHEGTKNFSCELCPVKYFTKGALKQHTLRVHEGQRNYPCDKCDLSFFELRKLNRHVYVVHEGNKDYQCGFCQHCFGRSDDLRLHIKKVHEGGKRKKDKSKAHCGLCKTEFNSVKDLETHYEIVHEGFNKFICSQCGENFPNSNELRTHMVKMHRHGTIKCDQCEKTFNAPSKLKNHIAIIHEKQRNYFCDECGKAFAFNNTLRIHKLYAHKEDKLKEKCSLCDKLFISESILKKHIEVVHRKIKKFSCTHCGKNFAYGAQRRNHIKQEHEKTAVKHLCDQCSKTFFETSKLRKHIATVHEGIKDWKCDQCPMAFSERQNLRTHVSTVHEKLKPYQCDGCGKSFGRSTDLKLHACKNDPKTYEQSPCLICPKIYKNALTRNSHMLQKHKISAKQYLKNNATSAE